jgi:hypothetical protein
MPEQMGLTQFFAMEAGDYLERLDAAVSKTPEPDRDEFVRLTRALRGSALMANQQAFAAAASGLERLARAVHDQTRPWDAATKQLAARVVDDLKILVRKATTWSDAETQKANQLAATLQAAAGGAPPAPPPVKAASPGQRAIIAQQGAGLASALDQAAAALQQSPQSLSPLQAVLKTMQPLRGIAGLADHPPLPDLLDGIDRASAELVARQEGAGAAADLFRSAARAIARTAQDIGAKGQADPDAPEAQDFARRLGSLLGLAADVVSIEALYFDDAGPHVVKQGAPPARPAKLGNLELVSHGEHLRQAADALERASSSVQRELRVHALVGTFHSLASAGSGPLGTALAAFAEAARDTVARGAALRDTANFARQLRDAGTVLSAAASEAEASMASRLAAVTAALQGIAGGSAAAPPPRVTPVTPHRPPAPSAGVLKPALEPGGGVAGGAGGAGGAEETPGLVGSYQRFDRLVSALGLGTPSLEELLAGPPAIPAASPVPPAPPVPPAAPVPPPSEDIVPITALLYSGDSAMQRLSNLREQVRGILAGASPDGAVLKDLIEEVFDLVELGAGRSA